MKIIDKNDSYGMSKYFSSVYLWMFIGLLLSGVVGYFSSVNKDVMNMIARNYFILIILELVVVIAFSALRNKVSPLGAKVLFCVYSVISGLTFSSIFIVYKLGSIVTIFFASALMFGLMALYGYVTKQDLISFGKMLIFGLVAVILMSIINIFVGNGNFSIIICIISVVIFLGLTAYDIQNLKRIYMYYKDDYSQLSKSSIYGALSLYLDFINIFLELLRLFGNRKN